MLHMYLYVNIYVFVYLTAKVQGNSRNEFGRCRLSCLLHYIHYLFIPLHTKNDISLTLFVNSLVVGGGGSNL